MKNFAAMLMASMLASACVPADVVPQQPALPASNLGLSSIPAPAVHQDWWRAFSDPQLDRLMNQALRGNPTLEAAMARMRAAQAQVAAQRSQLYPQLNLDAEDQRQRFSKNYIIPPPYNGTWQWMGTVQAGLSWNIDFWGKQAAQVSRAKNLAVAAGLDADAARLAVSGALVQAYVQLARAYTLADIARDAEAQGAKLLALTQERVHSGLDSVVALKEAQARYSRAKENRIGTDSNCRIVTHAVAALAGLGAGAYDGIKRPTLDLAKILPVPTTLPADLLARRPDILAAKARVAAAVSQRKVAAASFYPDVNLLAFAGWSAIGLSPLFDASSGVLGAGPAIHLPVFDAGKLRARYRAATADLDGAVADYNGALTTAVQQTADALTQIDALDREIDQHSQTLAAARDGFGYAQARYQAGLTNQLTVIDAENVLLQERQSAVSLAAERASQRVDLVIAVGGGLALSKKATALSSTLEPLLQTDTTK